MKLTTLTALAALAGLGLAQEPAPQPAPTPTPEKEKVHLPPMPGAPSAEEDLQKELVELFGKVELRLRAIDSQMYDAATGRVPTKPVVGSGIEELLRSGQQAQKPQSVGEMLKNASQDSKTTQEEIQRILRIAEQLDSKSKSSGSGKGPPKPGGGQPNPGQGGKSPLDQKPGGEQPGGREQTPQGPGSKPDGPKPGEGDKPQDGKQPDDPNKPAENRPGGPPPSAKTGANSGSENADRWGDLPVRAREIFRVEGASDLPPQYRDWIDGYYRRLQGLERR